MIRAIEIAILIGLLIGILSALTWRVYFGPLSERQKTMSAKAKAAWNSTLNTIADIRSEWVEYETTDNFLLNLPSLTNRNIPEVDAYHKMMLRLSSDYPAIEEMRKGNPDQDTLDFMQQIIDAHSKAKSRARQLDS
jgi:hypothetical protein